MSLLLIIHFGQSHSVIGLESDIELIQKDGYQEAVKELAERLKGFEDFGHTPTLPNIADTVLYHVQHFQAEIRSLNNQVKVLQDDLYKASNTPKDPQWVEDLKWEKDYLAKENRELKAALDKERSDRRLESGRLEDRIEKLEAENKKLYALLAWSGENKS